MTRAAPPRITIPAAVTPFRAIELGEILRIANSKLAALPWVRAFEIALARETADTRRCQTQIRAVPKTRERRAEFRYALPLADSGCSGFADRAWDMLGLAHEFGTMRRHSDLVERALSSIEPIIRAAAEGPMPPKLASLGATFDFMNVEPGITADLEMLGHDLKMGIERITAPDLEPLQRQVSRAMDDHRRRIVARGRSDATGALGWIDHTALAILGHAHVPASEAIEVVAREGWVHISFSACGSEELHGTLIQLDGRIEGWIVPRSGGWSLKHRELTVRGARLPETLMNSLPGRSVGAVFANAALPGEAVIVSCGKPTAPDPDIFDDDADDLVSLRLMVPACEIDGATGRPRTAGSSVGDRGLR
ncbi:hypothetical protein CA236_11250 [Sphingomonas sp. ABOLG]|jgi:hypothetical protein|uniref:hypothetical protein n=1 Tax=Sphingomonas sp. ABOLG TaxID=1985880 RepID=UPI000F7EB462|nr:hypothetical protein [Sphingomonas sp. ABOLG]RSV17298.1 hypothetical protein CA236_11250 [Sphingomonas sp. ABOLG]